MTFNDLISRYQCRPIPNCPGRFIIRNSGHLTVQDLCTSAVDTEEFAVDTVPDPVIICRFSGGGIISYRKADGTFVHTLNNIEGFKRKCRELGIKLKEE